MASYTVTKKNLLERDLRTEQEDNKRRERGCGLCNEEFLFIFCFYLLFCFASPSSSMCGLCLQMYLSTYVPCSCAIVVVSLRNMLRVTLLSLKSFSPLYFSHHICLISCQIFSFLLLCFGMLPCIVFIYKSPLLLSSGLN